MTAPQPAHDGEVCNDWCGPGSHHMTPCPAAPSEPPAADSPTPGTCRCSVGRPDWTPAHGPHAVWCPAAPSPVDTAEPPAEFAPGQLVNACRASGLVGQDLNTALSAYVSAGSLTEIDRDVMQAISCEGRANYLQLRFGSDGARVASIAYRHLPAETQQDDSCSTPGCTGDPRYAAPGRGHVQGCRHPFSLSAETQQDDDEVTDCPLCGVNGFMHRPDCRVLPYLRSALAARPSADTETLRDALRLIAGPAPHCAASTTERHACRQPGSGRTRGARYDADAWCDQCIARAALDAR